MKNVKINFNTHHTINSHIFRSHTRLDQCVTIAPGGFLGIYMLGTLLYLKNHYQLERYRIGGASAGAVLSIFGASNKPNSDLIDDFIKPFIEEIEDTKWSFLLQNLKNDLLVLSKTADKERIFVTATQLQVQYPWFKNRLRTNFYSSEDLVDFALASAFVPILSGYLVTKHNTTYYIDGAFTYSNPIPKNCEQILYISPSMWGRHFDISDCIFTNKSRAIELLNAGYNDAYLNKEKITLLKRPIWARLQHSMFPHELVWNMDVQD